MYCPLCEGGKVFLFLKAENFKVLVCRNCQIAFTAPRPVLPDYENMDFHSKSDENDTEKLVAFNDLPYDWKKLIHIQGQMVAQHFSLNTGILEIGCGEGILLDVLRNMGYNDLEGFEPSFTAAKRAQKRGLRLYNGYFDSQIISRQYDLVIMSHVLEHIENPVDFLHQVNSILKPGGALLLTQTNYMGLIPRLQKEAWYAWVPDQHFWHFTPKSLKHIFTQLNMSVAALNYQSLVHPHNWKYKLAKIIPSMQDQFILLSHKNK
jgi:2-polyprenyl-3-methyl-5-hydroxy-6-metoxy-1,4-benzoquinol methylase